MKWIDYAPSVVYDRWTLNSTRHDDVYDAIRYIVERETNMEEKKARGIVFDELAENLKEMGIILSEIRQEPHAATEITAYIDFENCIRFLEKKETAKEPIKIKYQANKKPKPKKVHFSGPATTILWMDGTKTTVKCHSEDVWSDEVGIAMCYLKKMFGNHGNFNNIFREAMKVAVVAEPKTKDTSSTITIGGSSYVTSAFDNMTENIDKINKCMKDAADALGKVIKEKK